MPDELNTLIESAMSVMGLGESFTYAQADAAFFARVEAMSIPEAVKLRIINGWLKATDHEKPSKFTPITRVEAVFLRSALERIVRAH